jgi:hypothetical protein
MWILKEKYKDIFASNYILKYEVKSYLDYNYI